MESDAGTFKPSGLSFSGTNPIAQCAFQETLNLLKSINVTKLILANEGSDIEVFEEKGVPGSSLEANDGTYFDFHHSEGDTLTVENSDQLDLCTAVWAATSYVIASLKDMLPR